MTSRQPNAPLPLISPCCCTPAPDKLSGRPDGPTADVRSACHTKRTAPKPFSSAGAHRAAIEAYTLPLGGQSTPSATSRLSAVAAERRCWHPCTAMTVCAFQDQEDAGALYQPLGERLKQFSPTLATDETLVITFGPDHRQTSMVFLGFALHWGMDRSGRLQVQRCTARTRLRKCRAPSPSGARAIGMCA
jgi:hypothetical protein